MRFRPFELLTSDIKEEIRDLPLAAKVAICGPPASGKSALTSAIRLALTGRHPRGHNPSDLIELAANPDSGIRIRLQSADGTCEFIVPSGPKKPLWHWEGAIAAVPQDARGAMLPMDTIHEMVKMGTATAREAFIKRWGNGSDIPTPMGLDDEQTALWNDAKAAVASEFPPTEILAQLTSHLRKEKLAKGRMATALEKSLAGRKPGTGAERIPELEARLEKARAWERAATARSVRAEAEKRKVELTGQLQALQAEQTQAREAAEARSAGLLSALETQRARLLDLEHQLGEETQKLATGEYIVSQYARALEEVAQGKAPACIFCGGHTDLKATHDKFKARVDARRASQLEIHKATLEARQAAIRADEAVASARADAARAETQLADRIRAVSGALASETGKLEALQMSDVEEYQGPPAASVQYDLDTLRRVQAENAKLNTDTLTLRKLKKTQEALSVLEKEAARIQKETMAEIGTRAAAELNRWMTPWQVVLDADSGEWKVFGADGLPHGLDVMCGNEEALLKIAWAIAWAASSALPILLLDDKDMVGLHSEGLAQAFKMIGAAVDSGALAQAFVVWHDPSAVPEGWTTIIKGQPAKHVRERVIHATLDAGLAAAIQEGM